jgi:acetyl esterase/lipase
LKHKPIKINMKKNLLNFVFTTVLIALGALAQAQVRFVEPVFTNVTRTSNIEYDTNRSVNILFGQVPGQLPIITVSLKCDIYQPEGDTLAERPVIILAHTGSYLPAIINRQPTGNKDDSTIVELATRFAKMGYVVVAPNYRLGWNAQTTISEVATEQLLKATYRAAQDIRNCVRFLNANASTYKIDPDKVIVGGQGTGGYVALAIATIDRRSEIENNLKFLRSNASPMVNVDTLGDWRGRGGVMLPVYPFYFNYSGDSALKDDIHMVFNYGGAMGDSAWLESSSTPIVSMHCQSDPFAPYGTGNVVVPTTGATVIPNASGAGDVVPKANAVGVNDKINAVNFTDPISTRAMAASNNVKNLFPFQTPTPEGSPWEWWDRNIVKNINIPAPGAGYLADSISMLTNPNMSAAKAKAYIDTIAGFIAPRIAAQFDLADFSTSVKELANYNSNMLIAPNPANSFVQVTLPVAMNSLRIVDVTGRVVFEQTNIGSREFKADVRSLNTGVYFIHVTANDGKTGVKRLAVK